MLAYTSRYQSANYQLQILINSTDFRLAGGMGSNISLLLLLLEPTFPVIDSSNISIQVFDPTRKPLQVKVGSHVTTLTGTPVAITCDVTGFPEPKVSWVKGRTAITGSDAERLLMSKSRISLLKGERSDSGLYMCTASGPGGQAAAVSNITFVGKFHSHRYLSGSLGTTLAIQQIFPY